MDFQLADLGDGGGSGLDPAQLASIVTGMDLMTDLLDNNAAKERETHVALSSSAAVCLPPCRCVPTPPRRRCVPN